MSIKSGNNGIAGAYYGSIPCLKIYKGSDLIFSSTPEPEPDPIPFIFTVHVATSTGSAGTLSLNLMVDTAVYTYDFDVDWGDGNTNTYTNDSIGTSSSVGHTYANNDADYTITISRKWAHIKLSCPGKQVYLKGITQWGNGWESLEGVFRAMIVGEDTISLPIFPLNKKVLSASEMFYASPDIQGGGTRNTAFSLILPDGLFKNLTNCVNFNGCFSGHNSKSGGTAINALKIQGQIFPDNAKDLQYCFGNALFYLPNAGEDASASSLPEDFLYNLIKVTTLNHLFAYSGENTGKINDGDSITLPNRWLPKNLSNCLNFNNMFYGLPSNKFYDQSGGWTGTADNVLGNMENIWDRNDINSDAEYGFSLSALPNLSNYDQIPMSWGALLTEAPTVTSSTGKLTDLIVNSSTLIISTKEGFTTLYKFNVLNVSFNNPYTMYNSFLAYTEPILMTEVNSNGSMIVGYRRNSDGKVSYGHYESYIVKEATTS